LLGKASTDNLHTASALALSPEDIRRLLEDGSAETRVDITNKIAGAYGSATLHEREFKVAEQIFRLLLRDTEVRVRGALAQNIKESHAIPRDIVMVLARDVEQVSLPVLQFSEVLTENDLLELVSTSREVSRYVAIAKRREVSQLVSNALLRTNQDSVTETLVNNNGADISEEDIAAIIEENRNNEGMMQVLGSRPRLPISAVEKLVSVVSGSLASTLKQKYKLPDEAIKEEVEHAREEETLQLMRNVEDDDELDKLIAQMHLSDRLSPSMILGALCQGNFAFFEASLARMSNIPISNARVLLNDKGDLGFRGLYNKSGLPEAMLPAVRLLLRVVRELAAAGERPGKARYASRVVEKILSYSEEQPIDNLSYIIALVRRST
jgi:uncharacterized protein (DUF2336 family)